jgi:glycosyltransferase involved in cell wall biosynthesis
MAKEPMTILYLDNSLTFGGAINSLSILVRNLDRALYLPVIVSGQQEDTLREKFPGCVWYALTLKLPWVNNRLYRSVRRRLSGGPLLKVVNLMRFTYLVLFVSLPESLYFARIGRRHQARLVHLNNIFGSQLSGILAARWLRVPCVAHLRDFEEVHPITRLYARLIDHHIAISAAVRDNLLDLGVPEQRISVIYNALEEPNLYGPAGGEGPLVDELLRPGRLRIGLFGRIVPWKGTREFIIAMRQVADSLPEACGVIVGDVSNGDHGFLDEMTGLVGTLDLAENILFTGFRRDVSRVMTAMDVIVHASTRPEPFGRVLIEAMAMGKPVVATRGGGPLEIVQEGVTGFLVDMENPEEMSRAILTLLSDTELARKFGRAGKERAERMFSATAMTHQVEALYANTIRRTDDSAQD